MDKFKTTRKVADMPEFINYFATIDGAMDYVRDALTVGEITESMLIEVVKPKRNVARFTLKHAGRPGDSFSVKSVTAEEYGSYYQGYETAQRIQKEIDAGIEHMVGMVHSVVPDSKDDPYSDYNVRDDEFGRQFFLVIDSITEE